MGRDRNDQDLVYADPRSERRKKQPDLKGLRTAFVALAVGLAVLAAGLTVYLTANRLQGRYADALALLAEKDYDAALAAFEDLESYRDSRDQARKLREQAAAYAAALALADQQRYDEAIAAFRALGDYADSAELAAYRVTYRKALDLLTETDAGQTRLLGSILSADTRLTDENGYPAAVGYEAAAALFTGLGDYADAAEMAQRCWLSAARVRLRWSDWEAALACREKMDPETAAQFDLEFGEAKAQAETEE